MKKWKMLSILSLLIILVSNAGAVQPSNKDCASKYINPTVSGQKLYNTKHILYKEMLTVQFTNKRDSLTYLNNDYNAWSLAGRIINMARSYNMYLILRTHDQYRVYYLLKNNAGQTKIIFSAHV